MTFSLQKIFNRNDIHSLEDITNWWFRGTFLLNSFFILFSIVHLAILVIVFGNGWIFFLLVPIAFIGLLLNIVFISGLFAELFLTKLLRQQIDFDKLGPVIKKTSLFICILIIFILSAIDLINQST